MAGDMIQPDARRMSPSPRFAIAKWGEGRGENSPNRNSLRFEPLQPKNSQVVDNQQHDFEVHGKVLPFHTLPLNPASC